MSTEIAAPVAAPPATQIVPLTKGKFSIVDADRFEEISKYKWYCSSPGCYAERRTWDPVKKKHGRVFMHRQIYGEVPNGSEIDHINRDKLDNRRCNLRVASHSQNNCNKPIPISNKSGAKGVIWHKAAKKFQAQICLNKKAKYLGLFPTIEAATTAYNSAAIKFHGEFAQLN